MSTKLCWTGLTLFLVFPGFVFGGFSIGAVVLVVGVVLMWFGK